MQVGERNVVDPQLKVVAMLHDHELVVLGLKRVTKRHVELLRVCKKHAITVDSSSP